MRKRKEKNCTMKNIIATYLNLKMVPNIPVFLKVESIMESFIRAHRRHMFIYLRIYNTKVCLSACLPCFSQKLEKNLRCTYLKRIVSTISKRALHECYFLLQIYFFYLLPVKRRYSAKH